MRKTIVFGPEDSATGTHRIHYRAAKGEKPVFTGGVPVTGWKPYKDGIWKAPLNRSEKLRALYVNDSRAVMANSGKKIRAQGGWGTYTVTAGQAPWAWQSGQAADGIKYNAADLPKITHNVTDVEIENQTTWNKNFVGVREIATEGDKYIFKLQQPYGAIAQQIGWTAGLTLDSEQIIHNALELLDQPGEFYFDRAEKTIYYIPRPGENMQTAKVVAPVTQTLIQLEGQPLKNRVRNITFEGLNFAYTDYNLMEIDGSHGTATVQTACIYTAFANPNWHYDVYRSYDVLPGAIIANAIEGIEFTRNTIAHTGCQGIVMSNEISDVRIVGNVIRDAGGSAITLGHPQHIYENDTPDLKHPEGAGIEHEKFPAGTEIDPAPRAGLQQFPAGQCRTVQRPYHYHRLLCQSGDHRAQLDSECPLFRHECRLGLVRFRWLRCGQPSAMGKGITPFGFPGQTDHGVWKQSHSREPRRAHNEHPA